MDEPLEGEQIRGELDEIFEVADRIRAQLRSLRQRIESSSVQLLELQQRRDELERQLQVELARAGARVYDWMCAGGQVDLSVGDEVRCRADGQRDESKEMGRKAAPRQQGEASETKTARIVSRPDERGGAAANDSRSGHEDYADPGRLRRIARMFPEIKESLGTPPGEDAGYPDLVAEASLLKRVTQVEKLDRWGGLPDRVQVCMASYVAARTRRLQSGACANLAGEVLGEYDARGIFARLNKHLEKYQPGFVYGLARHHTPNGDSWMADAQDYGHQLDELAYDYYGEGAEPDEGKQNPERALRDIEEFIDSDPEAEEVRQFVGERLADSGLSADDPRLVRLARPYRGHFEGNEFARLRRAFEEPEEATSGGESPMPRIPENWPWRQKLRDSSVLMVGADCRPEAEQRVETALDPENFNWVNVQRKKGLRQVESWAKKIEQDSVDIVILLTEFVSHSVSDMVVEAVKNSTGADLVFVNRGYGIEQIRRGIEDFVELEAPAIT